MKALTVGLSVLLLLPASAGAAAGVPSSSENDAIVMVITKWDSGSCSGSTRNPWDNMLSAWYDEITDTRSAPNGHGSRAWDEDGFYKNGQRVDSEFADSSRVGWGKDYQNDHADEPDALMVGLHGGHLTASSGIWAGRYYGKVRVDEAGDGNCAANQGHMNLGNLDLGFLHLSSCHSMCEINWSTDVGDHDAEWFDSFDGLHQINGFHGLMYISSTYTSRYSGFADDAFDISIANAWVDEQYSNGFWTAGDHCPTSMVVGLGEGSVETRMGDSEYDWVYDDPDSPTHWGVMWVSGCDPSEEPALP